MTINLKDRRCFNCHVVKPLDQYADNERRCRACVTDIYAGYPPLKICPRCKEERPVNEFNQSKNTKTGLYPVCRVCSQMRKGEVRKHKPTTPEKVKEYKERYAHRRPDGKLSYEVRRSLAKWGMTENQYQDIWDRQGGLCAICGLPETALSTGNSQSVKRLSVDHDHTTGRVRSLLCGNCNTGLGLMQDSVDNLQKSIDYLTTHQITDTI